MFSFNPEMAIGDSMDDGEEAFDSYIRDEDEEANGSENVSYYKSPFHYYINHETTSCLIFNIFYNQIYIILWTTFFFFYIRCCSYKCIYIIFKLFIF